MSIEIIDGDNGAALFCNTTDWAFGPVFEHGGQAAEFLDFADHFGYPDLRTLTDQELSKVHSDWLAARAKGEAGEAHTCPVCGGEAEVCAKLDSHEWVACRKCGADMRPSFKACHNCGTSLSPPSDDWPGSFPTDDAALTSREAP